MADTLATLIKLAGQKVERVQRELAEARRQLDSVHATQQKWRDDLARGDQAALADIRHHDAQGLKQASLFRERAGRELDFLRKVEVELDKKIAGITARLNLLFAEQKRYEILHEQKLLAARKKLAKKQQAALDEAASHRHG